MSTETASMTLRETLRAVATKPGRKVTIRTITDGVHELRVNGWCGTTATALRSAVVKGGAKGKAVDGRETGAIDYGDQTYAIPPGEDKGGAVVDAFINDTEPAADDE